MNKSTLATFANKDSYGTDNEYWFHIEQVKPEDITPTLGDVATLVDSLFGVDTCSDYDDIENTPFNSEEDYSDIPDDIFRDANIAQKKAILDQEKAKFFLDQVKLYTDMNLCAVDAHTGDYKTQILVGRSHDDEDYTIIIVSGSVGITKVFRGNYSKTYDIDSLSSIDLPFPVVSLTDNDTVFAFDNVVFGPYGYQTGPEITLSGRTLSWDGPITGSLFVSYPTTYDVVDITVYGKPDGTISEESTAISFYRKMVEKISLESLDVDSDATQIDRDRYCLNAENGGIIFEPPPNTDVVTCYENVRTNYVCRCAPDTISYYVDTQVTVPCPSENMKCTLGLGSDAHEVDGVTHCSNYMGSRTVIGDYVSCSDSLYNEQTGQLAPNPERSDISEAWYYEEKCCVSPDGPLPICSSLYEKNKGKSLDPDVISELERRYSDQLQLIPISPDGGDCGFIKTTVGVAQKSCCDDVEPLEIDKNASVTTLSDNNTGVVYITHSSTNTVTVSVVGSGFFAWDDGMTKVKVYSGGVGFIVFAAEACGVCTVTIDDGCTVAIHKVASTNGQWGPMIGDPWNGSAVAVTGILGQQYSVVSGYYKWYGVTHFVRQWETWTNTKGCGAVSCNNICPQACGEPATQCDLGSVEDYAGGQCYAIDSVFSNRIESYVDDDGCPVGQSKSCYCTCVIGNSYEDWVC